MKQTPGLDQQLSICDREEIHRIGEIQPHGFLIIFDKSDHRVSHCSANSEAFFQRPMEEILGHFVTDFLPLELWQAIEKTWNILQATKETSLEIPSVRVDQQTWDGLVFMTELGIAVELEKIPFQTTEDPYRWVDRFIGQLSEAQSVEEASEILCRHIRRLTGLDRVMTYRFLPNWDGLVIAEDKVAEAHSFLRHRFPATDIPLPARELYRKNRTRLIPDARRTGVPIVANATAGARKSVDLSLSKMRAVSPVHLSYLKNMNVVASFSVAIQTTDGLWGLVACHHPEALVIPLDVRKACERSASIFAMTTQLLEREFSHREKLRFEEGIKELVHSLRLKADPQDAFFREHKKICGLFACSGMALVSRRRFDMAGFTPQKAPIQELGLWLVNWMNREGLQIFSTDHLSSHEPKWEEIKDAACGIVAVAVSDPSDSVLILFRPEVLREIRWGGDPRKQLKDRMYEGAINPRQSFETWSEAVKLSSAPWRAFEEAGLLYLRDVLFEGFVRKENLIQELGQKTKVNRT